MGWVWRYLDGPGGTSEDFPSQSDAETWLGEEWRALLDEGVTEVELAEDGRVEYRMPLTPAE